MGPHEPGDAAKCHYALKARPYWSWLEGFVNGALVFAAEQQICKRLIYILN
jgi:hypothetical protein